ncbi:hypothetical protein DFO60_4809 [Ectopseudomonas oleovorans]|uniref:Uncharacterized protein n=1 Tax=Ectopseudomonas oleovorans TaxID=301 RepID=A0A3D9E7E5_ECTOL|nr:hypothetical protein DFO60_4809 [Pseudomonas oleovorans]
MHHLYGGRIDTRFFEMPNQEAALIILPYGADKFDLCTGLGCRYRLVAALATKFVITGRAHDRFTFLRAMVGIQHNVVVQTASNQNVLHF